MDLSFCMSLFLAVNNFACLMNFVCGILLDTAR